MLAVEIVVAIIGAMLVFWALSQVVRTVVVPRGEVVLLTGLVILGFRRMFRFVARRSSDFATRDRILSRMAPTALVMLPLVWSSIVIAGFSLIYWALGTRPWIDALILSGSSLTTLGFRSTESTSQLIAAIFEAIIGLGIVALLISFLPSIYGHFSRREVAVTKLFLRILGPDGTPSPATMLVRTHAVDGLDSIRELWRGWEDWFVELDESHTTFPALNFFRSPAPDRHWVTAAGLSLDSASLFLAAVERPFQTDAAFMVRTGFLTLRHLCDYFGLEYPPNPSPDDPISVTEAEFRIAYDQLVEGSVPVRDFDTAWKSFRGWRVNYDSPLVQLAAVTNAPFAPWISDRSDASWNPGLRYIWKQSRNR